MGKRIVKKGSVRVTKEWHGLFLSIIVIFLHFTDLPYLFNLRIYRGEPFHGARLDAFFGGIRMDLRNAAITEDEEIEIHTFFGGIELFVPQTVNVVVKSRSFIGGVDIKN